MYATLSLKRLMAILLYPFAAILLVFVLVKGPPSDLITAFRMVASSVGTWALLLLILGGFHGKWSPWRAIWSACPALNSFIFPDLNGVWRGKTSSNWPVIEALTEAAKGTQSVQKEELSAIGLQEDDIEMTIKASLFSFRISAKLSKTGGDSYSVTERVCRDKQRDCFEMYYVYVQDTPQPVMTDEGSHMGAARLDIDLENWSLSGEYWTMRSWRSGLNTAGLLKVNRVSRLHG